MGILFNPQLDCMGAGVGTVTLSTSNAVFAGSFLVSQLPSTGLLAFATNGRAPGELPSLGTGVPVYFAAGAWRTYGGQPVQS
jgi:hypothetical protein